LTGVRESGNILVMGGQLEMIYLTLDGWRRGMMQRLHRG
jgi:hypothetical protein